MAMKEIWRIIFFDKAVEPFEPSVAKVFRIIDIAGWCMGNYKIGTSVSPEGKSHPANETTHLFFGILIYAAVIPPAAGKPDNLPVFKSNYLSVNITAANRRSTSVAKVMVAKYIKQWNIVSEEQALEVFRREIAAGQDEVDIFEKGAASNRFEQFFSDPVRNYKNFHVLFILLKGVMSKKEHFNIDRLIVLVRISHHSNSTLIGGSRVGEDRDSKP